jgi:DNA invertase Pin-like site-specific DNA recombinase
VQHTVLSVAGLKGTISEFEVNLFRQRSTEAILQKARRGELQIQIPVGFCWAASGKLEKDPDRRVQQAIDLVFRKMTLGNHLKTGHT